MCKCELELRFFVNDDLEGTILIRSKAMFGGIEKFTTVNSRIKKIHTGRLNIVFIIVKSVSGVCEVIWKENWNKYF